MPSELALHIGNAATNRWRDGDIVRVTFTYDAQRVIAETISNGRHSAVNRVTQAASIEALAEFYEKITDPNRQPQPRAGDLLRWWTLCETLTGLDRNDFSNFPYTGAERRMLLIVPLTREATMAERGQWTGKTDRAEGQLPIPKRVDWQADVMPGLRVRVGRKGVKPATNANVRDPNQRIRVLDPIDPSKIRSRT